MSYMQENPQQEFLLRELIGERMALYANSPYFHDAVTRLAHSLPALVEALAAKAELEDRRQRTAFGDLMRQSP